MVLELPSNSQRVSVNISMHELLDWARIARLLLSGRISIYLVLKNTYYWEIHTIEKY